MRTILLEEHYAYPGFFEGPGRKMRENAERLGGRAAKLLSSLLMLATGESRR